MKKIIVSLIFSFFIIIAIVNIYAYNNKKDNMLTYNIYTDTELHTISKGIFWTNIEWINNWNGIYKEWVWIDNDFIQLAKKQWISNIRFPWWTFSDFYHWKDWIGNIANRPTTPHYTDSSSSKNLFWINELYSFSKWVRAEPLITVNVWTADAQEAADWVDYCNNKDNALRIENGFKDPFNIKLWEVWNELYLNWNEAEKKISIPPEEYSKKFLEYSSKMRQVDKNISLMAIWVSTSYNIPFWPYWTNWNETVLKNIAWEADYIAVHNAYFPMLLETNNQPKEKIYRAMWWAPEFVDKSLTELEKLIEKYEKGRDINIAITEWWMFFSFNKDWIDHTKTLGSSIYAWRLMQVIMSHPKVKIANYFKFTDQSFMWWVTWENKKPKIPYYIIQLYSKYFGDKIVKSDISSPIYNSEKVWFISANDNIKEITAISSINETKNKLFINFVSRSLDKTYQIKLNIKWFDITNSNAVIHSINSPTIFSNNWPDLPSWWPIPYTEPEEYNWIDTKIKTDNYDISKWLSIPPHSIITVEFTKKE